MKGGRLAECCYRLPSNYTPTNSNYSPTALQLCFSYAPTTLQLHSNYIPTILQLCSNYVPYTPTTLQLGFNYTRTTLQLGSNYTPTMLQLHSIFPQGLPSSSLFIYHVSHLWLIFNLLHQLILSMCACIHVESSTGAGKPTSGQAPKEKGFPVPSSHRLSLVPQRGWGMPELPGKLIGLTLCR